MQIILLAAGIGNRMGELTKNTHKSLLPLNKEYSFLSKLMHQLNEYEIKKLIVVTGYLTKQVEEVISAYQINYDIIYNKKYKEDINIFSMKMAMDYLSNNDNTIVIESDIIIDDLSFRDIYFESKKNKSIWFTRGKFHSKQYGGILKSTKNNEVEDIKIVKKYNNTLENYYKLLGIMTIGKNEFDYYKKLVKEYSKNNIKQYYLVPWINNLDSLPTFNYDLKPNKVFSINTEKEYNKLLSNKSAKKRKEIILINIDKIKPIENIICKRVRLLKQKISNDKKWIKPIIIDNKNHLLMDGHHRLEAAKLLGLKKIPAIKENYKNVEIWSLKESEKVTKTLVEKRALSGNIYPNKTVKHYFNFNISRCNYPLTQLTN